MISSDTVAREWTCEVCDAEPVECVCCVPGVPYSAAYGRACLAAGAHPWHILVANTVCMGGYENGSVDWKEMVLATCTHLKKSLEDFKKDVATATAYMERDLAASNGN